MKQKRVAKLARRIYGAMMNQSDSSDKRTLICYRGKGPVQIMYQEVVLHPMQNLSFTFSICATVSRLLGKSSSLNQSVNAHILFILFAIVGVGAIVKDLWVEAVHEAHDEKAHTVGNINALVIELAFDVESRGEATEKYRISHNGRLEIGNEKKTYRDERELVPVEALPFDEGSE